jgi:hypothetical protein
MPDVEPTVTSHKLDPEGAAVFEEIWANMQRAWGIAVARKPSAQAPSTACIGHVVLAMIDLSAAMLAGLVEQTRQGDRVLADRIAALEAQLAAVEQRGFNYRGVWRAGEIYEAGCYTTDHGSMWHANRATRERPGGPDSGWTLCVKAGKDGRDARA